MASITKTQGTSLITLQQVASNMVVVSGVQDVSTKLAATIYIHLGRDDTAGNLSNPAEFRLEGSAKSSGNDQWFPLAIARSNINVPEAEAVTATVSAGQKLITMSSTTNYAVGQHVFIKNTTLANSEFGRIKDVDTNTSITVIDDLTNAQTGSTVYNRAELFTMQVDLTSVGRIRLVADCSSTGRTTIVEALMTTGDSIG
jgi:hypothetical protein